MKKTVFLSFVSLGALLLSGCGASASPKKVYIPFGKLYDSSSLSEGHLELEKNTKEITHSGLSSLVQKKKNFILIVYEKDNACACFKTFEKTVNAYLHAYNDLVYSMKSKEFDGGHDVFGVAIAKGESTICVFENGEILHQRVTNGANDDFLAIEAFAEWMNERVSHSDMLYIGEKQLDSLFEGDSQFTVGFLRSSCGDCSYVEDSVLSGFNKKKNNVSYVIDCDEFDGNSWKGKYGLTEASNEDYGYGEGYVPTFVRYSPTAGSYAEAIMDSVVYLNDKISLVDGVYKITQSFYSERRAPLLGFLGNTKGLDSLLLGKTIDQSDVISKNGEFYWAKEKAAIYHNPLLEAFLNAYVSIR